MITIYTAGSARQADNIWIGSYGFSIHNDDVSIYQISQIIEPTNNTITKLTVNVANLMGIIHAIHKIRQTHKKELITIYTDNEYIVNGTQTPEKNKTNKPIWALYKEVQDENIQIKYLSKKEKNTKQQHVNKIARDRLREYFNDKTNS